MTSRTISDIFEPRPSSLEGFKDVLRKVNPSSASQDKMTLWKMKLIKDTVRILVKLYYLKDILDQKAVARTSRPSIPDRIPCRPSIPSSIISGIFIKKKKSTQQKKFKKNYILIFGSFLHCWFYWLIWIQLSGLDFDLFQWSRWSWICWLI